MLILYYGLSTKKIPKDLCLKRARTHTHTHTFYAISFFQTLRLFIFLTEFGKRHTWMSFACSHKEFFLERFSHSLFPFLEHSQTIFQKNIITLIKEAYAFVSFRNHQAICFFESMVKVTSQIQEPDVNRYFLLLLTAVSALSRWQGLGLETEMEKLWGKMSSLLGLALRGGWLLQSVGI